MTREELFEAAMDAYEAARSVEEGVQAVIDMVLESTQPESPGTSLAPVMRNPNGKGTAPVRSVRVSDDIWNRAKSRAALEGVSISQVIVLLALGYADHSIDLPDVSAYYEQPAS